jgi:protein transport protein SEC31
LFCFLVPEASTDSFLGTAKGDRTHIPAVAHPIYTILSSEIARVKARAPTSFKPQVDDTEKRLNLLFDHLNNEELLRPDTVQTMVELSQALERREFDRASALQMEIHRDKVDECGNWMVGVKRLVGMCRATPY